MTVFPENLGHDESSTSKKDAGIRKEDLIGQQENAKVRGLLGESGEVTQFSKHFQAERESVLQSANERMSRLPQNATRPVSPLNPFILSEVVDEAKGIGAFTIFYPIDTDIALMQYGPSVQYRCEALVVNGSEPTKSVKEIHAWDREEDIALFVSAIEPENRTLHLMERRNGVPKSTQESY